MNVIDRPSKYSKDYLRKLFQYSLREDIANAISHSVGGIFAIYALINLTWIAARYGNWIDSITFIFYGFTILFMFTMSTLYHSMLNHTARSIFKKMDHISIYLSILGTYTPYVFSLANTLSAYIIYGLLLLMTIIGIIIKSLYIGRFRILSTLIYVIMGWAALFMMPVIAAKINTLGLWLLISGGIVYTAGAAVYAFSKFKYSHMVWHIFVFFGALLQYLSVAFCILQYRS